MPINESNYMKAVKLVGPVHAAFLRLQANKQDKLEQEWEVETERMHQKCKAYAVESLKKTGKAAVPKGVVEDFLLRHYFQVLGAAAHLADQETDVIEARLSAAKKPPIPRSLRELKEVFDRYRKSGRLPKGLKDMADQIKKQYLKKTQSIWRKYSEDYRNGDVATQEDVIRKVKRAVDAVEPRAKTIVRTETTNYYNDMKREIYDESDAVTHYLFLAIRDQGTTKWCTDRVQGGKRGRHGLVYSKGDPLTAQETPACHWNCRSEMVPLSPYNPRHAKLIADQSLNRRQHTCHPLPEGWR